MVAPETAAAALASRQLLDGGREVVICGHLAQGTGRVVLETSAGGERILEELETTRSPASASCITDRIGVAGEMICARANSDCDQSALRL